MASLKTQLQKAVKQAFNAFGDVPVAANYYQRTLTPATQQNQYDVATGGIVSEVPAPGEAGENVKVYVLPQVFFLRYRQWEIDRDPSKATDMKMCFPAQDLPVQPTSDDFVVDAQGRKWEIVRLMQEPSQSVTCIQVRTNGPPA